MDDMNDKDFLKHIHEIHQTSEDIQFTCLLVKNFVPIVDFIQQANFVHESIEAFLYQQLNFQKIYKRLESKKKNNKNIKNLKLLRFKT